VVIWWEVERQRERDDKERAYNTSSPNHREYHELQTILQLNPITRHFQRCDKDTILKDFYSKRSEDAIEGYEEEINI
jgi:hypothetical protein